MFSLLFLSISFKMVDSCCSQLHFVFQLCLLLFDQLFCCFCYCFVCYMRFMIIEYFPNQWNHFVRTVLFDMSFFFVYVCVCFGFCFVCHIYAVLQESIVDRFSSVKIECQKLIINKLCSLALVIHESTSPLHLSQFKCLYWHV